MGWTKKQRRYSLSHTHKMAHYFATCRMRWRIFTVFTFLPLSFSLAAAFWLLYVVFDMCASWWMCVDRVDFLLNRTHNYRYVALCCISDRFHLFGLFFNLFSLPPEFFLCVCWGEYLLLVLFTFVGYINEFGRSLCSFALFAYEMCFWGLGTFCGSSFSVWKSVYCMVCGAVVSVFVWIFR